jgi:hypothetical protein
LLIDLTKGLKFIWKKFKEKEGKKSTMYCAAPVNALMFIWSSASFFNSAFYIHLM